MDNEFFFIEGWTIDFVYRGLDNQVFLQSGGQSSFFTEGGQSSFFTDGWTINFFLQSGGQSTFF